VSDGLLQIEFKLHGSIPSPSPASGVSALTFQPNSLRLFGMRQGVHLNKPFFFDVEAMSNYKDKSWYVSATAQTLSSS
jgi:hypothetical protein